MSQRVVFVPSVLETPYGRIAQLLQERHRGLRLSAVVNGASGERRLRGGGAQWERVETISRQLQDWSRRNPDFNSLRRAEAQYGTPNLYLMAQSDPFIWQYDWNALHRAIAACFQLAERVLDDEPSAVFAEGVDSLPSYALFAVARARAVPFTALIASRLPGRVTYYRNVTFDDPYELDGTYQRYLAEGMPGALRREAQEFIEAFRRLQLRPEYLTRFPRLGIGLRDIGRLASLVRVRMSDRNDYIVTPPVRAMTNRVGRIARARRSAKYFEKTGADEKYAFYGLHYQPEATTLTFAPFRTDQANVVESIAKSLPVGWRLYVKEHPTSVGRRDLAFYERLRRIPVVRLISPHVHSHTLISRASAVITVTGTIGWEAVMYRRPVITLGPMFINRYAGVRHVASLTDLPVALSPSNLPAPPEDAALEMFVGATLESTFPALLDNPAVNPGVMDDENCSRLTDVAERALDL
jgi:hypothetical protein